MTRLSLGPDGAYLPCKKGEETHILMTEIEYENMKDPVTLRIDLDGYIDDANKADSEKEKALQSIRLVEENIADKEKQVSTLKDSIQLMKDNLLDVRSGNKNLLRMIRDKSNADRDLRPKKEHCGYVPMRINETQTTISHDDDNSSERVTVWETTFESPYPATLQAQDILETIIQDLSDILPDNVLIIGKCDVSQIPEEYCDYNIVFNYNLSCNFHNGAGLWAIKLLSTQEISISQIKFIHD